MKRERKMDGLDMKIGTLREQMMQTFSASAKSWCASVLDALLNEIWLNNTRHLTNDYADLMREVSTLNVDAHVRAAFWGVGVENDVRGKLADMVVCWCRERSGQCELPPYVRSALDDFREWVPTLDRSKSAILRVYAESRSMGWAMLQTCIRHGALYSRESFVADARNRSAYQFQYELMQGLESEINNLIGLVGSVFGEVCL